MTKGKRLNMFMFKLMKKIVQIFYLILLKQYNASYIVTETIERVKSALEIYYYYFLGIMKKVCERKCTVGFSAIKGSN